MKEILTKPKRKQNTGEQKHNKIETGTTVE